MRLASHVVPTCTVTWPVQGWGSIDRVILKPCGSLPSAREFSAEPGGAARTQCQELKERPPRASQARPGRVSRIRSPEFHDLGDFPTLCAENSPTHEKPPRSLTRYRNNCPECPGRQQRSGTPARPDTTTSAPVITPRSLHHHHHPASHHRSHHH